MTSCYVRDGTSSPFPPSDHISSSVARFRRSNIVCRVHRQAPPQTLTRHLSSFYWQSPIYSCLIAGTLPSMSKKKKKKGKFKVAAMLTSKDKRGIRHKPSWIHDEDTFPLFPPPLDAFSKTCPALASAWKRVCLQAGEGWAVILFTSLFLEFVWDAVLSSSAARNVEVIPGNLSISYVHTSGFKGALCVRWEQNMLFWSVHEKINTAFTPVCKIIQL